MAITTITKEMVSVNAIQGTLIADNAITAVHIATNAVSGTLIADNAVTATHIAQNTITVTQLANDAVEADKIADGVITTNHLNKAMISSQTEVTAVAGDFVLIGDTSDSNNLKKAPVSSLAPTGSLSLSGLTVDTSTLAVDATNNRVGIGTTSPAQLFHVSGGTSRMDGDIVTQPTQKIYLDGGLDTYISEVSANAINFFCANAERMRLTTTGLGIGTASPNYSLDVDTVGKNSTGTFLLTGGNSASNDYTQTALVKLRGTSINPNQTAHDANSSVGEIRLNHQDLAGNASGGNITFHTNPGNNINGALAERMIINKDGEVGIGTTSPSEALEVVGNIRLGNGGARSIIGPTNESLKILANPNATNEGIIFSTDGGTTTEMFIKDGGDVGIGTTSPNDKFGVLGSSTTLDIGADDSAEVVAGFVPDSTNNRNGRLRIAGTTTPTNNSIALISDSSSNVGMSFVTTGSGTKGERMVIGTTGNVGIGTTSPSSKLTVTEAGDGNTPTMHIIDSADTEVAWFEGNRAGDTGAYIAIRHNPSSPANSNRAGIKFQADDSAGNVTNYATAKMYISDNTNGSEDASLAFNTIKDGTDTEALRVQAGFVGIGDPAANDGEKFKVENNGTCAATIYANEDSSARDAILRLQTRNGSAQSKIVWLYGDGAGTYNGEIMHDYGEDTTSFVVPNTKSNSAGAFMYIGRTNEGSQYSGLQVFQIGGASAADRKWKFQTIEQGVSNSGDLVFQQSGGLVGIGTDNPVAKLTVNGSFSKSSGSFRIPHPLPALSDTKDLVHSFIEGPQADLIYRGTVDLVNGSATVNIDTVAGMTDGTFVALCREVQCFTTNEDNWDLVKASVSGNILTIQSQNSSSTATISWLVIGERKDPHMYDTEWTDSEGKIIIEPNQRK